MGLSFVIVLSFVLNIVYVSGQTSINYGMISTLAGSLSKGGTYSGDGGLALNAGLDHPTCTVVDQAHNIVYITDVSNPGRVRVINVAAGTINAVAGGGTCIFTCVTDNTPAIGAFLNSPAGLYMDNTNNLLIADSLNHRIARVIVNRVNGYTLGNLYNVAGYPCTHCLKGSYGGDGQVATSSSVLLNNPQGVACDSAGNIFIADTSNHRIRMIRATTKIITTIAGNGQAGYGGDNGPSTSAILNSPLDVACDSKGNVYIADSNNNMLRMIHMNNGVPGMIMGLAGIAGQKGYNGDNMVATSAWLYTPAGVFLDAYDNPYVADRDNNRIRKITQNTLLGGMLGEISTIAGNGVKGYSGDGGPATNAQLSSPAGLAVDRLNNIWIADTGNNLIRRTIAPSPSPTAQPTLSPSPLPSTQPTMPPSAKPTQAPSPSPTKMPSAQPTALPTPNPSPQPSTLPSAHPTFAPSALPTALPTQKPSAMPTFGPSALPTALPSALPSPRPSPQPSSNPSPLPTMYPSALPTPNPSANPTPRPSPNPSSVPSPLPTSGPSPVPSAKPSCVPTPIPTAEPSANPSPKPSALPSANPTPKPSALPSPLPTVNPSNVPSPRPSPLPTALPTLNPTPTPSALPTRRPTTPSSIPTGQPTSKPSVTFNPELDCFKVSQFIRGITADKWSSSSLTNTIFKDAVISSVPGYGLQRDLIEITSITDATRMIKSASLAKTETSFFFLNSRARNLQSANSFVTGVLVNYTLSYFEMDKMGSSYLGIVAALQAATSGPNNLFDQYLVKYSKYVPSSLHTGEINPLVNATASPVQIFTSSKSEPKTSSPTGTVTPAPDAVASSYLKYLKLIIGVSVGVGGGVCLMCAMATAYFYYRKSMRLQSRLREWDQQTRHDIPPSKNIDKYIIDTHSHNHAKHEDDDESRESVTAHSRNLAMNIMRQGTNSIELIRSGAHRPSPHHEEESRGVSPTSEFGAIDSRMSYNANFANPMHHE